MCTYSQQASIAGSICALPRQVTPELRKSRADTSLETLRFEYEGLAPFKKSDL